MKPYATKKRCGWGIARFLLEKYYLFLVEIFQSKLRITLQGALAAYLCIRFY